MSQSQTKRSRLIAALLSHKTVEQAANSVGMTQRHAWRLLSRPDFKDDLAAAREKAFEMALSTIQGGITAATSVLIEVLNDAKAPYSSKISASRTIIESALRVWELRNLEDRLKRLEERVNDCKRN